MLVSVKSGSQYRSTIFVRDSEQEKIAQRVKRELQSHLSIGNINCFTGHTVVTAIQKATHFYPAPEVHQDFLARNPGGYCNHFVRLSRWPSRSEETIMARKEHGTCSKPVQDDLRFGCDVEAADQICCFNRHNAEQSGYFIQNTDWQATVSKTDPTQYFDSVTGALLFTAPIGRSFDAFLKESIDHGWPSFRDEEVNWTVVRLMQGEACTLHPSPARRIFSVLGMLRLTERGSVQMGNVCQWTAPTLGTTFLTAREIASASTSCPSQGGRRDHPSATGPVEYSPVRFRLQRLGTSPVTQGRSYGFTVSATAPRAGVLFARNLPGNTHISNSCCLLPP